MTKQEDFHKSAMEQNNKTSPEKKDTASAASAQAKPRAPGPPVPKPPFGMPIMPVLPPIAKNIKVIEPAAVPKKTEDEKDA